MGLYNTITLRCPKCGEEVEEQSKAGSCTLDRRSIHEAEPADLAEIMAISKDGGIYCENCQTELAIDLQIIVGVSQKWRGNDEEDY